MLDSVLHVIDGAVITAILTVFLIPTDPSHTSWIDLILNHFDPSLLQNVILGILALFTAFLIAIFSEIRIKNKLVEIVFYKTYFKIETIFWLSIFSIAIFAFFHGESISCIRKVISIIIFALIICVFWWMFKKLLQFLRETEEILMDFFTKLEVKESNDDQTLKLWGYLFEEKFNSNFTEIFIKHVEVALKLEKYGLSTNLIDIYTKQLPNMTSTWMGKDLIGTKLLPKILQWDYELWSLKQNPGKQASQELLLHWPLFSKRALPKIMSTLLPIESGPDLVMASFKKHVDHKLELENTEEYLEYLLRTFLNTLFDEYQNISKEYYFFKDYFPPDWKVTSKNSDELVPHIVWKVFCDWFSRKKITHNEQTGPGDGDLMGEISSGLFPTVDERLFRTFLMLIYLRDLKKVITSKPNFYISNDTELYQGGVSKHTDRQKEVGFIMKNFASHDLPYFSNIHVLLYRLSGKSDNDKYSDTELVNCILEILTSQDIEQLITTEDFRIIRDQLTDLMQLLKDPHNR